MSAGSKRYLSVFEDNYIHRDEEKNKDSTIRIVLTTESTMAASHSPLTTHVLDVSLGKPAKGMEITLHRLKTNSSWELLKGTETNEDGRAPNLLKKEEFVPGTYKLMFRTKPYFEKTSTPTFYPYVEVVFDIIEPDQHYHVPLLISPYGYSTYRGS